MTELIAYCGLENSIDVFFELFSKIENLNYNASGLAIVNDTGITLSHRLGDLSGDTLAESYRYLYAQTAMILLEKISKITKDTIVNPLNNNDNSLAIVFEGKIENSEELKNYIGLDEVNLSDSQIFTHLFIKSYSGNLLNAMRNCNLLVDGNYYALAISEEHEGEIVCSSNGKDLYIGSNERGCIISNSIDIANNYDQNFSKLKNSTLVRVNKRHGYHVFNEKLEEIL